MNGPYGRADKVIEMSERDRFSCDRSKKASTNMFTTRVGLYASMEGSLGYHRHIRKQPIQCHRP